MSNSRNLYSRSATVFPGRVELSIAEWVGRERHVHGVLLLTRDVVAQMLARMDEEREISRENDEARRDVPFDCDGCRDQDPPE